jgi:hypothetical protein
MGRGELVALCMPSRYPVRGIVCRPCAGRSKGKVRGRGKSFVTSFEEMQQRNAQEEWDAVRRRRRRSAEDDSEEEDEDDEGEDEDEEGGEREQKGVARGKGAADEASAGGQQAGQEGEEGDEEVCALLSSSCRDGDVVMPSRGPSLTNRAKAGG